jgi:hypothetical protein
MGNTRQKNTIKLQLQSDERGRVKDAEEQIVNILIPKKYHNRPGSSSSEYDISTHYDDGTISVYLNIPEGIYDDIIKGRRTIDNLT